MTKKTLSFLTASFLFFTISAQFNQKLPTVKSPVFKRDTIDIRKLGAIPDGHFLNTKIINRAIENSNKKGGGVVLIPPGLWLTGPVVLLSNVNLYLTGGATLLFTKSFDQYPLAQTRNT